jgi:hypothetical protein
MWVNLSHMLGPLPPSLYAPSYCKCKARTCSDNKQSMSELPAVLH